MNRSKSRILTTHAGALPRPDDLLALNAERAGSFRREPEATHPVAALHRQRLRSAVRDVVDRQIQLGIDIVNDGEFGKAMRTRLDYGAWISYVIERFTGFEDGEPVGHRFTDASDPDATIKPGSFKNRRDRQAFPELYADIEAGFEAIRRHTNFAA